MFSVFKNINNFANKSKLLDAFAIFCARYLLYLMLVYLLAFAYAVNDLSLFINSLLAGLFAVVIGKIVDFFYKKRRPAELESTKILIPVPRNLSFPSRHASITFGVSFYILFYNVPLAVIFIICSSFVGIARVFCGVHWFRDILGGVVTGLLSAVIIYYLLLAI